MALKNLSKGRFDKYLTCPLTAWRLRHEEVESIPADDYRNKFLAEQGHIVGEIATLWFDALLATNKRPKGINIDAQLDAAGIERNQPEWLPTAVSFTQRAMADPNVWAIYEATFNTGSFTTRADILARTNFGSWNMIEVKSIMEKREASYINDMTYTTGVLVNCGVKLHKIGLMRIDRDFVLQNADWLQQPEKLLDLMDVSWKWQEQVMQTLASFNAPQAPTGHNLWQIVDWMTSQPNHPAPNWHPNCKDCVSCRAAFPRTSKCHPVLDLPHIGNMAELFQELTKLGVYCLEDVPTGFFGDRTSYERVAALIVESVKRNQIFVGKDLKNELRTSFTGPTDSMSQARGVKLGPIIWPVLYLDFEFLQTALPLYDGCHPYEGVPFEYSLHCVASGDYRNGLFVPNLESLQHRDYISDPQVDDRYQLAKKFMQDIQELGASNSTIMVYNRSAEETCIEQLANHVEDRDPQLAESLRALYPRMVDLYAIISRPNLYHPNFHGSFKLKTVIKTFLPELYANLNIASGDAALAAYGELAYAYRCPKLSPWEATPEEKDKVLQDLRKYCHLDTYSLAVLHYQLALMTFDCPQCFNEDDIETFKGTFKACPACLLMVSPKDRGHGLRCKGYITRQQPWKEVG